jgi:RNA polymerase sigma-70 factor (ECF subfamily)
VLRFEAFYSEHFAFAWRTLRRLGVAEAQLDDAAQEVFIVVHRRLQEFRPDSSPKAWLYAIAQRVASDHRRSHRRKGSHLSPLRDELATADKSPLDSAMQRQAEDLVLTFLDTLDAERRTVFILTELEQMSAPEVARIADANLNTTYYRIQSARKAFAAFVDARRERERSGE